MILYTDCIDSFEYKGKDRKYTDVLESTPSLKLHVAFSVF